MSTNAQFQARGSRLRALLLVAPLSGLAACSLLEASDERDVVTAPGTAVADAGADGKDAGDAATRMPDDRGSRPRDRPARDGGTAIIDASTPKDAGGPVMPVDAGKPPPPAVVPDGQHCTTVRNIDPRLAELEERTLVLINKSRARGEDCGREGYYDPTSPLIMQPQLRCAARLHSLYMADTEDFAHTTRDGVNVGDRIVAAGYDPWLWGENIASGQSSAENAVADWLASDGHCRNLMDPEFTETGIGLAYGEIDGETVIYWTQNFATP